MNIRKEFIVDKQFQYSFILKNLLLMFFTFALIIAVLYVWKTYQVEQGFLIRPPLNREVVQWAKENNVREDSAEFAKQFLIKAKVYTFFELLWKPMLLVLVINIVVLLIANIYYSHTIAGPIHRLKIVLEKKLRGEEVYEITFRKNDAFHELADIVNEIIKLDKLKK